MKRQLLTLISCAAMTICAFAFPQAIYVKTGDIVTRYNFGVAGDLNFSPDGKTLHISGYDETIDLTKIDCITFSAPVSSGLTPSQQKQKLIEIGEHINNSVDVNDQRDLLIMIEEFNKNYSGFELDIDTFDPNHAPHDTDFSPARSLSGLLSEIGKLAAGNPASVRSVQSKATEFYKMSDFYGVYKANIRTETWDRTGNSDHLEFTFPAADGYWYTVSLNDVTTSQPWLEENIEVNVPDRVIAVGKKGDSELFSITMDTKADKENLIIDLECYIKAGSYNCSQSVNIHNSYITERTVVNAKGIKLVDASSRINGAALLDYDAWKEEIDNATTDDEWYNPVTGRYQYTYGDLDDKIAAHFYNAVSTVDVLGELQVRAKASMFSKWVTDFEDYRKIVDARDGEYAKVDTDNNRRVKTYYYNIPEDFSTILQTINNYSDASFFYDGTQLTQGYLAWDLDEWVDEYQGYDGYKRKEIEYTPMPFLVFPDQTSFSITDFFNEVDFTRLINDYEDIIDTYMRVVGRPVR